MSKSRDIADSAATINYIDTVTSNVQDQIDSLDPLPSQTGNSGKYLTTDGTDAAWGTVTADPTLGTLTKTFTSGESASISLTSSVLVPVVSVTKEVPQSGVTNNSWDVNSTTENYTRLDSAAATTLDFIAYDVANGTYSQSFSFSSQDAGAYGLAFNDDGTKMYMTGIGNDYVYQYNLSTAFDVSTSVYTASKYLAGWETAPIGFAFNNDGTRMYVLGGQVDDITMFSLSTAYDITTATFEGTKSVAAQDTDPRGIAFNNDGTKVFVVGDVGSDVNEYLMSTAYDITTATYTSNFSLATQEQSPNGIAFDGTGKKMFISGSYDGAAFTYRVLHYALTTAFDVSTASFVNSLDVGGQDTDPSAIAFNNDGSKLFMLGAANDNVFEYSLPPSVELGTGSFASADVGKTIEANSGAFILTATDGSYVENTAPTSYAQVASGDWSMYGVVYNATDGDLQLSGYLSLYNNISNTTYTSSASAESGLFSLYFKPDGLAMFIMSSSSVYSHSLSTAWDVTTAVSTGSSYSFASQVSAGGGYGLVIGDSGTKMYLTSYGTHNIYQYSLSTAWDITSASFTKSQNTPINYTDKTDLAFNPDGTKLYVVRYGADEVVQISLTTAWDIASMTGTGSVVLDVSARAGAKHGVAFNPDGTKVYVSSIGTDFVYEYLLNTAYDLTGASYSGNSFDLQSQVNTARSTRTDPNGLYLYVADSIHGRVYQYSTGAIYFPTGYQPVHTTNSIDSTYWTDINSMTADQNAGDGEVYYAISTDDRTTWTVIDETDGERDIVRNNAGTWQYNSNGTYASETWVNGATNTELATLAEAMEGAEGVQNNFDVGTGVYSQSFTSAETDVQDISFNNNGTKMFTIERIGDSVHEYTLSTGFDVTTASFSQSLSIAGADLQPSGLAFNTNGTKMFFCGYAGDNVYEYNLSTGFDISSATYSRLFYTGGQDSNPQAVTFNNNGTKMFILGQTVDAVFEYGLSTGFDLSTASYTQSFSVAGQETQPRGMTFNNDGTRMYVTGATGDDINQYELSTGFDVSTATYSKIFSVYAQTTSPQGVAFNTDGSKMYVVGQTSSIFEYNIGSALYTNRMDKTQLDAVTDPNHIALGNDLDLAIVFNMTSGSTVPSSDGVAINYDASVMNKGAVLGTDYDFDAPAQNSVRITALAGNNLKVRVV